MASFVYFAQLLGAACTQNLVKTLFSVVFNKKSLKKDNFEVPPQGYCMSTSFEEKTKMEKNIIFWSFLHVFSWLQTWNHWKKFKNELKSLKTAQKMFWPAFGCVQHLKAGQNTQQARFTFASFSSVFNKMLNPELCYFLITQPQSYFAAKYLWSATQIGPSKICFKNVSSQKFAAKFWLKPHLG